MSAEQTLVLNQGYEPCAVVGWRQAITLWYQNKAEILVEYDRDIRSTYLVVKVPAVIRLLNMFRRFKKPVKFSRSTIYARDKYECQYCGKKCLSAELTYDHVVPRTLGGKTNWTNIVSACFKCNSRKGGRTPEQAKMVLRNKPVQPVRQPSLMIHLSSEKVPEAWREFLYWNGELEQD